MNDESPERDWMEGSVEPDIETAKEAIRLAEQVATLVMKG